ncbi:MAG: hypothetical protein DCC68_18710 [Planctomycetota bacterium]|nr:MAG: hypothetical protein DCC68_18710 [Planctomycetota bacterium]
MKNELAIRGVWRTWRLTAVVGNRALFALGVALAASSAWAAAPEREDGSRDAGITATFSIVAVDPESGVCGAAVASKYPAVGRVVPYVRAGVGAFCTQHWHEPKWGEPALDALAAGNSPQQAIADLLKDDPRRDQRQLAIVDMQGRTAQHNPTAADGKSLYWGAMSGRFYACQGNTLAGRDVVTSMGKAYEQTRGSVADRLMAALVAADKAGGDHRGRLAAGIRVARKGVEGDWLYLGVDESDDAVAELAKKYAELKHDAKGSTESQGHSKTD